jgi:hypothetical protein
LRKTPFFRRKLTKIATKIVIITSTTAPLIILTILTDVLQNKKLQHVNIEPLLSYGILNNAVRRSNKSNHQWSENLDRKLKINNKARIGPPHLPSSRQLLQIIGSMSM